MEEAEFVERVLAQARSKHVVFSKERMEHLIRQKEAGLVWLTHDLAKNTCKKAIIRCMKKNVPCIVLGSSDDLLAKTRLENVKVVTLRKSFPGLAHLVDQIRGQLEFTPD